MKSGKLYRVLYEVPLFSWVEKRPKKLFWLKKGQIFLFLNQEIVSIDRSMVYKEFTDIRKQNIMVGNQIGYLSLSNEEISHNLKEIEL